MGKETELLEGKQISEIHISRGITVGGFDIEIRINDESDKELYSVIKDGSCSLFLQRILLKSNLTPQGLSALYIHEVFHAIDKVYLDDSLTEIQIAALANGWLQILEQLGVRFVK